MRSLRRAAALVLLGAGPGLLPCLGAAGAAAQGAAVSLAQAYGDYFPIGAAISPEADLSSPAKQAFIATHYNSVTAENQMKPRFIHPAEDRYNWEPADRIVAFARAHGMKVRGHTLVWHQSMPEWMLEDGAKPVSRDLLYSRIQRHITDVMERYRGDVYCWDVVNEAISDSPGETFRARDPLHAIAGTDYVAQSFRLARQADPRAQLFYNDYRFSNPVKRRKIYDLLESLKKQGVPIDGVGLQSHYVPDEISEQYLQETIDMFRALGLKVQITELDVSVYNYRDKSHPDADQADDAYTEARQQRQLAMYDMLFRVYRRNAGTITGVTFWGAADSRANFRTRRIGKMDYPFLFDETLQPKKAFDAITAAARK
jgi:endo-1,4-beta-xylanase